MADLKTGTTIGGGLVWTQLNFPLFPTNDTLLYKTYKVYTEYDKPQATDNDFVSKANGGIYQKGLTILGDINIPYNGNDVTQFGGGLKRGNGDDASIATANIDIASWNGVGIWSSSANRRTIVFSARTGDITSIGGASFSGAVTTANPPTAANHLTRRDYVDGLINIVTTNANSRVLKSGDTMTGVLTAPAVSLNAEASNPNHAARLSQVVVKATVIDYGTFV